MVSQSNIAGEWYHGDLRQTNFHDRKFDVEDYSRDRNAVGPGIYFTRDKSQASGYAENNGYIYTVTVNLNIKRTLEDNTPINIQKLKTFIISCPDKESLLNYSENMPNAIVQAVKMNVEYSSDMHDAIMGAYNDLYQRDSVKFAETMVKIGYDALLHKLPGVDHLIVYNPGIINIIKEESYSSIRNLDEGSLRIFIRETLTESFQNTTTLFHGTDYKDDLNEKSLFYFSTSKDFSSSYGKFILKCQVKLGKIFDTQGENNIREIYKAGFKLKDDYITQSYDETHEIAKYYDFENDYYPTAEDFINGPFFSSDTWEAFEHTDGVVGWIFSHGYNSIKIHEGGVVNYYTSSKNIVSKEAIPEKKQDFIKDFWTNMPGYNPPEQNQEVVKENIAVNSLETFIHKIQLGPGLSVKFAGDNTLYYIKNIAPDRQRVFVQDQFNRVYNKKIQNIVMAAGKQASFS